MSTNFQPTGSLFGQSMQQPQQTSGLFGNLGQTQPGQQASGLFGGFAQPSQNQQQQQGVSFGTSTLGQNNQLQQSRNLSLGFGTQQQQQQQLPNVSIFGQSQTQSLPPLGQGGIWQPNGSISSHEKSVPEQMAAVFEKWDSSNRNCAFKYYFYNKVDDNMAPYYRPGPNDDPKAWDEALSNKPDKGYIPVLCVGFAQMGERIKLQQRNLANFNARLHEINNSLSRMMQDHETRTSIKAMDARRKHTILKQRCIALATKVQVLRNRGYALGGDEEDLKIKLLALERQVKDPALGARGEEIWARMLAVQDRANLLKSEIGKAGQVSSTMMGDELTRRAKKILEDYYTQLNHLSSEMESIKRDYEEWVKEKGHSNTSN
ncbi:putative nucleoporin p54 [Blumeria hordei DH14]|uniref:Putative nucleoporin p54 n=1 Tax=Blumeria graminis f. sp. hordei (strain DH14) TaxID=546991 RepID=N1J898_BLUG1|nr:putative nucleoporin p54 [Blumeria hordei DH14]